MSEFTRQFSYDKEGEPVMEIRRKIDPHGRVYQINMGDLWAFSEEHNGAFLVNMFNACRDIYQFLGIGDFLLLSNERKAAVMGDIAAVIQGGIDEHLGMAPGEPESVDDGIEYTLRIGE